MSLDHVTWVWEVYDLPRAVCLSEHVIHVTWCHVNTPRRVSVRSQVSSSKLESVQNSVVTSMWPRRTCIEVGVTTVAMVTQTVLWQVAKISNWGKRHSRWGVCLHGNAREACFSRRGRHYFLGKRITLGWTALCAATSGSRGGKASCGRTYFWRICLGWFRRGIEVATFAAFVNRRACCFVGIRVFWDRTAEKVRKQRQTTGSLKCHL